jgi:4-hydroxybenzoate polyprenyltransferase
MTSPRTSTLLAHLRLFRLPNIFTAASNVTVGYLLVHAGLVPLLPYLCVLAASCLIYTAGMVLNDLFDAEVDARERPQRPIPSGRISAGHAARLGWGMLAAGVIAASIAGYVVPGHAAVPFACGAAAFVLAACGVGYNAVLKKTMFGSLGMGLCRFLNIAMAASLAPATAYGWLPAKDGVAPYVVAAGIGVYIVGVTMFARGEAGESARGQLLAALGVMAAGLLLVAMLPMLPPHAGLLPFGNSTPVMWWVLLALVGLSIGRRGVMAVVHPSPENVQAAVKVALISLIALDAVILVAVQGPLYAVAVLGLLLPTVVIGRWVYST